MGAYGAIGALICSFPVWLPLLLTYMFRLGMRAVAITRPSLEEDRAARAKSPSRLNWVWLPLFVMLSLSTLAYPWPLVLRFQQSQSEFEQAVKDVQAGRFNKPRRVGLYYVSPVTPATSGHAAPPGVIRFEVGNPSLPPDETGFEFAPNSPGRPPSSFQLTKDWRTYSF